MGFRINIKNKLIQIKNHKKLKKIEQFLDNPENKKYSWYFKSLNHSSFLNQLINKN